MQSYIIISTANWVIHLLYLFCTAQRLKSDHIESFNIEAGAGRRILDVVDEEDPPPSCQVATMVYVVIMLPQTVKG
jgi:hypothetical protein